MITYRRFPTIAFAILTALSSTVVAQQASQMPGDNAALRYWSAFAQMQDSTVTAEQAKGLQAILDGVAPYSDVNYRELVERNRRAVETLQRGTTLPRCDWGVEYQLGPEAPVDYVRRALALGRLNVLYAYRQLASGNRSGGMRTLAGGIRFSHDVAGGGTLIAGVAAKTLMVAHLRAVDFAARTQALASEEKTLLSAQLDQIGPEGVDWHATMQREFEVLERSGARVPASLVELYGKTVQDAAQLPQLQQAIAGAPQAVASVIPRPQRVLEQKRELNERLREFRAMLR